MKKTFSVKLRLTADIADENQSPGLSILNKPLNQFINLLATDPEALNNYYLANFYHQFLEDSDQEDTLRKSLGYVDSADLFLSLVQKAPTEVKLLIEDLYNETKSKGDKLTEVVQETFSEKLFAQLGPLELQDVQFSTGS